MRLPKIILWASLSCFVCLRVFGQNYSQIVGDKYTPVAEDLSVGRTKSIAHNYYQAGSQPGTVAQNVNVFTGQPEYAVPLGTISIGSISFPIAIEYGGPTHQLFFGDNLKAPTGVVGLGWSMEMPYVAVNGKGTITTEDDIYFAQLGPFGSGQILQSKTGGTFYLSTNPGVKVEPQVSAALSGQIEQWIFTMPDGTKLFLGQRDDLVSNSERVMNYGQGNVQFAPGGAYKPYIYRWDLYRVTNFHGTDVIEFSYEKVSAPFSVGNGFSLTQNSQIKDIFVLNAKAQHMEDWSFTYGDKSAGEFISKLGPSDVFDQTLFGSRYLKEIDHLFEGVLYQDFVFSSSLTTISPNVKRLLDSIQIQNPPVAGAGAAKTHGVWRFIYNPFKDYLLGTVVTPQGGSVVYDYAQASVAGLAGDQSKQDATIYLARRENSSGTLENIPDPAESDNPKWGNEVKCDERFCYIITRQHDGFDNTYLEVVYNNGNYFKTKASTQEAAVFRATFHSDFDASGTLKDRIDILPYGDDFLMVDYKKGYMEPYTWNPVTETFAPHPDPTSADGNIQYSVDAMGGIGVFPGANFIVVQGFGYSTSASTFANVSSLTVFYKNHVTGEFEKAAIGACGGSSDYGVAIHTRVSGPLQCQMYDLNDAKDFKFSVGERSFTLLHTPSGLLENFVLNADGKSFSRVGSPTTSSTAFPRMVAEVQDQTFPNHFLAKVDDIQWGPDYLLVVARQPSSRTNAFPTEYLMAFQLLNNVFFPIGSELAPQKSTPVTADYPVYEVWPQKDYFVAVDHFNDKMKCWKFGVSGNNVTMASKDLSGVATPPKFAKGDILVRAYPNLFTVEYYPEGKLVRGQPEAPIAYNATTKVLPAYIYRMEQASDPTLFSGGGFPGPNSLRLYNLQYSPSDGLITGEQSLNGGTTTPCNTSTCTYAFYSGVIKSYDGSTTPSVGGMKQIPFSAHFSYQEKHMRLGLGLGIGALYTLQEARRPEGFATYQLYKFNGESYADLPAASLPWTVSSVTNDAGLDGAKKNKEVHTFNYFDQTIELPLAALDMHSMLPQYSACLVSRAGHGGTAYRHNLLINGDVSKRELNGQLKTTVSVDDAGTRVARDDFNYISYSRTKSPAWPLGMQVPRLKSQTHTALDLKGDGKTTITSFYNFNDNNNSPAFKLENVGTGSPVILRQTLFNSMNLPIQEAAFRLSADPGAAVLESWNAGTLFSPTDPITAVPMTSEKREYKAQDYLVDRNYVWRDWDDNLSPEDMKTGVPPQLSLSRGWLLGTEVTKRNARDQTEETHTFLSNDSLGEHFSSAFYEGFRPDPVGAVKNARLDDCAILTGENFDLVSKLDASGRWESVGASISTDVAHTGRGSIKVVDNFGPTINLTLKDAQHTHYGFTVTAWVLAVPGTTPAMLAERRHLGNVFVDAKAGQPVGEVEAGGWQRWEIHFSFDELVNRGMFGGNSGDFLRIWIGIGPTSGNPAKVVYVDDIACRPDNSEYTLRAFNEAGQETASIDNLGRVSRTERNVIGQVVGTSDFHGRMFSQGGYARMKEIAQGSVPFTFTPTADAHVRDGSSAATNFGTAAAMEVRTAAASSGLNNDAYLKFSVTGLNAGSIYRAKLRFQASTNPNVGSDVSTELHSVSSTSWTETGITWNNKPAMGSLISSLTVRSGLAVNWYEVDVTSQIAALVKAGGSLITFGFHNPTVTTSSILIPSRTATPSFRPQLIIQTTFQTAKPKALFVVGSTTPALNSGDQAVWDRLYNRGFDITVVEAAKSAATDASGKKIVLISSTVSTTNVTTKFRTVTVPVLTWESGILNSMGMTGATSGTDFGTLGSQTKVSIINTTHAMAGKLTGTPTVSTSSTYTWGVPNSAGVRVAALTSNAARATIFGYEKGAVMPGLTAPARRVGFFLTDGTAAGLTSSGWTLFDAAVTWAAGL